ncbi:hypothetical protein AWRI1631_52510, partial [Saccharomyces cerevisiae AWRI1631]
KSKEKTKNKKKQKNRGMRKRHAFPRAAKGKGKETLYYWTLNLKTRRTVT